MGISSLKVPYAQPWYRPQLEETIDELERSKREILKLKDALSSVAKERDAAFDAGRRSAEIIVQKGEEAKLFQARIDAAEEAAERERQTTEAVKREMEAMTNEKAKLKARVTTLSAELDDLKTAMAGYLDDRVKAEKISAESVVSAAAAQAEARLARQQREDLVRERDAAKKLAEAASKADAERAAIARKAAEKAETERRARLEARLIKVLPDTREFLDEHIVAVSEATDATLAAMTSKFIEPKTIWDLLEPTNYGGQHDAQIVLLSGAWLRQQRPTKLPDRHHLPAEAIMPVRSLRAIHASIEKGMGKMSKPLPVIAIVHGQMRLETSSSGAQHPDPEGLLLDTIVKALEARWADFTRRRGGNQSTGVTDIGVFVDWSSLYQSPCDAAGKTVHRRTEHQQKVFEDALSNLHMLFAHQLTTVWMIPEAGRSFGPNEISYSSAWPTFLREAATLVKPSNGSDVNAWPQLLMLGEDHEGVKLGRAEQEKVPRGAPPEPLSFSPGHALTHLDKMSKLIVAHLPNVICDALAGVEELDYRRCGWGDEEASWLAVVLPLCGRLKRLLLSCNRIGDAGATALAAALSSRNLQTLEVLALDNNDIGDAGASALFQRMSPDSDSEVILRELKTLSLSNNALNDASVTALSGALAVGALRGCKKVALDGNAASKATVTAVKKAMKKR